MRKHAIAHGVAGALLGVSLCIGTPAFGQGFQVFGYAATGPQYAQGLYVGQDGLEYAIYNFNLTVAGIIAKKVFGLVEFESEEGHLGGVEQTWLAWQMAKNHRIIMGKFILPFGAFSQYYHVPWIHKLIIPPMGLQRVAPMPLVQNGIYLNGAMKAGNATIMYDIFTTEGWEDIPNVDFADLEEAPPTSGGAKLFGARAGVFLPMGLEFHASFMSGANLSAQAVDFYYRKKAFLVRAEYDMYTVHGKKRSGYFAEVAYRTRANIEPVVVISGHNIELTDGSDNKEEGLEIGAGINYHLSAASAIRLSFKQANFTTTDPSGNVTKQNGMIGAATLVTRF